MSCKLSFRAFRLRLLLRSLDPQAIRGVYRFHLLYATSDGRLLFRRDRLVAIHDEFRGLGFGPLGDVRGVGHAARVLDAQGQPGERQFEGELEPGHRAALAPEVRGAPHLFAPCGDRLALVEVDAEPDAEQIEDVARRQIRVEVRLQAVEDRDDRVEHVLERPDEAHPEVFLEVDRRQRAAHGGAVGYHLRRLATAAGELDHQGAEARPVEGLVVPVPVSVSVGHLDQAAGGVESGPPWLALTMCWAEAISSSSSSTM